MPGVARASVDSAGGIIRAGGNGNVRANGSLIAVCGSSVSGHGDSPHSSPSMRGCSSTVKANGIGVCRIGDSASCGHGAGGTNNVRAGG